MVQTVDMKITHLRWEQNKDIKMFFKEVSRPGGQEPIISTWKYLQYLHMKGQF